MPGLKLLTQQVRGAARRSCSCATRHVSMYSAFTSVLANWK